MQWVHIEADGLIAQRHQLKQAHETGDKDNRQRLRALTADVARTDSGCSPCKGPWWRKDPSLVFTGATPPRHECEPALGGLWFCSQNTR